MSSDPKNPPVLRPRTIRPGGVDDPAPVVRPRTVDALGPPQPIAHRDLPDEYKNLTPQGPALPTGLDWQPPTGPVPLIADEPAQPTNAPAPAAPQPVAPRPTAVAPPPPPPPPPAAPAAPATPVTPQVEITPTPAPVAPQPAAGMQPLPAIIAVPAEDVSTAPPSGPLTSEIFTNLDWDDVWTEDQAASALATRTDELGTVDRELVTGDLIDRGEWSDVFSFTGEVSTVPETRGRKRATKTAPATATGPESPASERDEVAEAATPRRMLRNNLFVASGTAVSRATGLIRSLLILRFLIGGLEDAYNNANNTPNQIYELILGGVLTATLVPLFTDDLERKGKDNATSAIISTALVALVAISVLALIAGPGIILFLGQNSPNFNQADYIAVGVKLALLFAPQVFFYGLMAVWSAVLNSRHRFLAAAWAPVLNNLIAIATLIVAWRYVGRYPSLNDAVDDPTVILILGIGTTLGIAVMALALYPSVRRSGVRVKFKPQRKHPAVQRAIRLSGWTFGYVTANLIAVNIVQFLAEPGSGGATRYTTAFQFFQLPHGLLAVSIMVTFEPLLGRADVRGDRKTFNDQLLLGYRLIALLVIPAGVGYVALQQGIDGYLSYVPSASLDRYLDLLPVVAAFAVGLPAFSMYLYSMRAFYAMKNTKTPFLINLVENLVNLVAAFFFVKWWGIPGLALSYSLAYTVGSILAISVLTRRSPGFAWTGLTNSLVRLVVAATIMGGTVFGVVGLMAPGSNLMLGVSIAVGVAVGGFIYLLAIMAIGVQGIDELFGRLPGLRRLAHR